MLLESFDGKKSDPPGGTITGSLELPGDKSISHRYAILAALAEGTSEIQNYASAADCQSTLECIRRLGIAVDATRNASASPARASRPESSAQALSTPKIRAPRSACSSGVLAGQSFTTTLTGDARSAAAPCAA